MTRLFLQTLVMISRSKLLQPLLKVRELLKPPAIPSLQLMERPESQHLAGVLICVGSMAATGTLKLMLDGATVAVKLRSILFRTMSTLSTGL